MLAGFPFPKNSFPSWRTGRSGTLSFSGFSLILWIVFHATLDSSRALTFVVHCTLSPLFLFLLPLGVALGCSSAKRRAFFKLSFTRRETLLTIFLSKYRTTIFQVWCSLANHLFEQYLECTATAMASAALTVDPHDKITALKFPRLAASSSRLWFHPTLY